MTMMFLQRAVFIIAIFLCCFQSCLCVDCEKYPYHPSCRGTMKRMYNPDELPSSRSMYGDTHNDLSTGNCKSKIKYLLALLSDDINRPDNYPHDDYEAPVRRKLGSEQKPRDILFGMRNMIRDYID
ncbi:uncharacterized protein LOC105187368 [Harpegnathos saltator]|uniref:uncharacterized protein LOC105187368 n=1 Tax=Harpegnathos saltator TaxID=610380 RepID=UPI00059157F0|nr:uncharacterized protein LOC105187368 [Harpegnathos saltator]